MTTYRSRGTCIMQSTVSAVQIGAGTHLLLHPNSAVKVSGVIVMLTRTSRTVVPGPSVMHRPNCAPQISATGCALNAAPTGSIALQRPQMHFHFPPYYARWLALSEELHGHMGCVNRITWNEDGTKLASGSDDRKVLKSLPCLALSVLNRPVFS